MGSLNEYERIEGDDKNRLQGIDLNIVRVNIIVQEA